MTTQPYNFPNPNAWSWNAAVEQDIPRFATLTLAYVGRRGLHLQQMEQLNQLQPGTVQAHPGVNTDALRPYRGFSSILQIDNAGRSIYHSMQVNLNRRLSHGLLFGVAYTWSKSMTSAPIRAISSRTTTIRAPTMVPAISISGTRW